MTDNPNRPMIENSDRGITMAKPLAWTVLVSICGAVWYGGATVERQSADVRNMLTILSAVQSDAAQREVRVRNLEATSNRSDERLAGLRQTIDELKAEQRRTNELLTKITGEYGK